MPGQHTDNHTFIHARSANRQPHLHPCQGSSQKTQLPSMPGQDTDFPISIDTRSRHRVPNSSMPGQHTDQFTCMHARSAHGPPYVHPCQVTHTHHTAPSMPGQHTDHPTSIQQGQLTNHLTSIPLTGKDKKLMEASSWERLTVGKTGSCSDGESMLSKSLMQSDKMVE